MAAKTGRWANDFGPRFSIPILIGPALNPINTTMIAVALLPIQRAVGVSAATVLWLVAGLYVVSAVCLPAMGKLSDAFGPRRVQLAGLLVVAAAGVVPLACPTFPGVLAARLLIGLGTSCAYPSSMTLIADQSRRLDRQPPQVLLSALSLSSMVMMVVGPVLGGVLVQWLGWQWIFLVNVPVALAALALVWAWLPPDSLHHPAPSALPAWRRVDPLGMALFAGGSVAALFFLLDLGSGWYGLLALSVVAFAAFVAWERRAPLPFVDVRMLARNGPLARTYARFFLTFVAIYLVTYSISQWLQSSVGVSAGVAGLMQLPASLVAAAATLAVARTPRVRLPLLVTSGASALGGLLVAALSHAAPLWTIVATMAVFGIPQGLGSVSNQAVLYRQAPASQMGVASGLSRTALQSGAIAASSVIGVVFGARPSDAGMDRIGFVIAAIAAATWAITAWDPSLREGAGRARPFGLHRHHPAE